MDPRAHLRALAAALPAGTAVPVPREWLLKLLGAGPAAVETSALAAADLTVHDLATRFHRKPSTIRMWLEAGRFPHAYLFQNREWRVPPADLTAFEAQERERARPSQAPAQRAAPVEKGAWRRYVR